MRRMLARQELPVHEPSAPGHWATLPGTPFASPASGGEFDIDPNDVTQGDLGDCWLAAAMAAVARARPELIRSAIHDRGDTTYDVSLYIGEDGNFYARTRPPRTVRVTSTFPVRGGAPTYARPGDTSAGGLRELWPMLIEKAYAAMISGGYPSLSGEVSGVGRVGGLPALVGAASVRTAVADRTSEQILGDIGGALTGRRPVVCLTPAAGRDREGIRANHAYAPIEVAGSDIHLQDPNDHTARIVPVERFRPLFATYEMAGDDARHDPGPDAPVRLRPDEVPDPR